MNRSLARSVILFFVVFLTASGALAQSEAQRLTAKLLEHYQRGELDAALPIAEEIVAIERRNVPVSSTNLTSSIENLAQIRLARVKRSMAELRSPEMKPEKALATVTLLRQDAASVEASLREALQLSESSSGNLQQQVSLRTNLAWLLYNHIPAESNQSIGFDKESRDKLEMQQKALYVGRFDEARTLYTQAAKDSTGSAAIGANFNLAEFETAMGNFEASLPLYSKVIADAEKLLGMSDPQLMGPYEAYLKALIAAGQQDQAYEILSKIVSLSGKSTQYPKTLLNLTYRADKAFVPINSSRVEDDSRAMKEQAELAGRGNVARAAAAGGDIVGTSLAVSTHGRDFYETTNSKGVRMSKIAVKITLDETGKVTSSEGLSSNRNLKVSAERAVRDWKFRPLMIGGRPAKLTGYAEVTVLSN